MARQGSLAALIAALAACAPAQRPESDASGNLEISAELEPAMLRPREGDIATLAFSVRNGTKNVVLLRDLSLPADLMVSDSSGAVATWQLSLPGLLVYSQERNDWLYERSRRSDGRRPIFNSGLLVPGESILVRARVRLLDMPMDFQFSYFELPLDEVRRKVYFEVRQGQETRYSLLIGKELEARLIPSDRTEMAGHRFVIFPHAEPLRSTTALLKTLRIQENLQPRSFTLAQAAHQAGVPLPRPRRYTFCALLDGWVIPRGEGHLLVTPASVTPLPEIRQMERVFYFLDTIGQGKIEVELRGDSIATTFQELNYQIVAQQRNVAVTPKVRERRTDYYLFLEPPALARFFSDLRSLKLAIDVAFNPEGGGRFQVLNK